MINSGPCTDIHSMLTSVDTGNHIVGKRHQKCTSIHCETQTLSPRARLAGTNLNFDPWLREMNSKSLAWPRIHSKFLRELRLWAAQPSISKARPVYNWIVLIRYSDEIGFSSMIA